MDGSSPVAPRDVTIPLHDLLQLEIVPSDAEVDGGPSVVRMPVQPGAFGFTANLHGGAIATLVDVACALAAARATGFDPTRESLVTSDMHVRYLGRPRTSEVLGRAEIVRLGTQLIVVECRVVDSGEHLVAVADFSMMRVPLRRPLTDVAPADPSGPEL